MQRVKTRLRVAINSTMRKMSRHFPRNRKNNRAM